MYSEPIVIHGAMVPDLVGKKISDIRVFDKSGKIIPFQIDEITDDDEYICSEGKSPNSLSSNGCLDLKDEIVFLLDDCSPGPVTASCKATVVPVEKNDTTYNVLICSDSTIKLSDKSYIVYDQDTRILKTPFYYAQFALDRFHFVKAGVASKNQQSYLDLTSELGVEISMKTLFGLVTIHYTEDNLICFVKRWKAGPIRLIRRGDFHLNLGLGLKGSKAAVNQICYPQMVKVPVLLHIPVRFRSLFKNAFVSMAPVITRDASSFHYTFGKENFSWKFDSKQPCDTFVNVNPCRMPMIVSDGLRGYGWYLQTTIPDSSLAGSGILFRKPSARDGLVDCGYRLSVEDVEKGYYDITNWVLFPDINKQSFSVDFQSLSKPARLVLKSGIFDNRLSVATPAQRQKKK